MELSCYSRLNVLLAEREMNVVDLYRNLKERGVRVNNKSLYRLSNPLWAVNKIDARIAGKICELLGVDLSSLFTFRENVDLSRISSFPPEKQARLDALLEKNCEGIVTNKEKKELAGLIEEAEHFMLTNVRILSEQRRTLGKKLHAQKNTAIRSKRQKS